MRHMLNEEETDWDLLPDRAIGSVLCGESTVTVKGHTFQASSVRAIMTSESVKITLKWDRWIKV